MNDKLITRVTHEGQKFLDEPQYAMPKPSTTLANAVADAFGERAQKRPLLIGHERVRLKWVKGGSK